MAACNTYLFTDAKLQFY